MSVIECLQVHVEKILEVGMIAENDTRVTGNKHNGIFAISFET